MNHIANPDALLPKVYVKGCIIQINSSLAINSDQINWVIAKSQLCFELQKHTLAALCCLFQTTEHISNRRGMLESERPTAVFERNHYSAC